ncbi:hypothetical protein ABT297_04805 [Dactylosporangium sp. NPDC000555]|uniref:hypothetical protein n=1 Tax=Dactylosporangium sp. NPDC000555 TaxID=3154260 RepID=UPI003316BA07
MDLATPPSRLRRGVRRFVLTICALILGAGFTPALPSTVEPVPPASVSFAAGPSSERSTVDEPAAEPAPPVAGHAEPAIAGPLSLLTGRRVGAVASRAPPAHQA